MTCNLLSDGLGVSGEKYTYINTFTHAHLYISTYIRQSLLCMVVW